MFSLFPMFIYDPEACHNSPLKFSRCKFSLLALIEWAVQKIDLKPYFDPGRSHSQKTSGVDLKGPPGIRSPTTGVKLLLPFGWDPLRLKRGPRPTCKIFANYKTITPIKRWLRMNFYLASKVSCHIIQEFPKLGVCEAVLCRSEGSVTGLVASFAVQRSCDDVQLKLAGRCMSFQFSNSVASFAVRCSSHIPACTHSTDIL